MKNEKLFTAAAIFTIGFLFNVIFSLTSIIIPLYGLSLGYSATQIGLLLSIPGFLQVFLRMFSGALSDYFGEKKMLGFTYCVTIAASLIFNFSAGLAALAFYQVLMGVSRAIFWPTSQSYASRISSTQSSSILGKFHSFNESGKIFGILFAGWAIVNIGYIGSFRLIALIAILGLLAVWLMKRSPVAEGRRTQVKVGASFPTLIKVPPLQFALLTAFCAGLLVALLQSFFPIWLKGLGHSEGLISVIITANLVGSVLAGRFYVKLLEKMRIPLLMQLSFGVIGSGYLFVLLVKGLLSIFILNFALGFFTGMIAVSYQVMVVNNSTEANRGLIMSFVGLGWGSAFLVGPTLFGLLVDSLTITAAFGCLGGLILIISLFTKRVYSRFVEPKQETGMIL